MRKFLFVFFLIVFLSWGLVFAQETVQKRTTSPPKDFQEAKEMGKNALIAAKEKLPTIMRQVWEEQIVPFWKKIGIWLQDNILSKMERNYNKVNSEANYNKVNSEAREKIKKQEPLLKKEAKEKIQTSKDSFWTRLRTFIESKFGWVFR